LAININCVLGWQSIEATGLDALFYFNCSISYIYTMMIMTKAETLYFNRLKARGLIKPLRESAMSKVLKMINAKLPISKN